MARRFDWDDLQFFLAVARTGTISLAGRRLGTDHATVSRRIDKLEAALGTKLFERNPRGYNLTQAGEKLVASAEAIEAEARNAERQLAGADLQVSGTVRISCLEGFGNFFLAERLPKFASAHPNLLVEFITIQQILALSRREADIAITLAPPQGGRFVCERLVDYELNVYGSAFYLDAHPPIRTPEDFLAHVFVGYIDDLIFTRGLDYLDDVMPGLKARFQSSSLAAQLEAVASGFGLGVLPAFMAAKRPDLVPVLPDRVSLIRSYWLVAHQDSAEIARIRLARRFVRDEVAAASAIFRRQNHGG